MSVRFRVITVISTLTKDPEFWKDGGELKALLGERAREITLLKGVVLEGMEEKELSITVEEVDDKEDPGRPDD